MKSLFYLVLSPLLVLSSAHGSWREGNGGDALKSGDKWYLLDLMEAGAQNRSETPVLYVNSFIQSEVNKWALNAGRDVPQDLVASKLQQVYDKNKVLALALLSTLTSLDWKWLDFPLRELDDEGNSVLDLSKFQKIQAALRIGNNVNIQARVWDELNPVNQAALLFHETIYSMIRARRNARGIDTNSPRVRRLVGFLFSSDLALRPINEVLLTEALDVLIYPSGSLAADQPRWSRDRQMILLDLRWTAETLVQNLPTAPAELRWGLGDAAAWIRTQCRKAIAGGRELTVGLTADQVRMQLSPENSDPEQKDFYYSPQVVRGQWLQRVTIPKIKDVDLCARLVRDAMNHISQEL